MAARTLISPEMSNPQVPHSFPSLRSGDRKPVIVLGAGMSLPNVPTVDKLFEQKRERVKQALLGGTEQTVLMTLQISCGSTGGRSILLTLWSLSIAHVPVWLWLRPLVYWTIRSGHLKSNYL